MIKVEIIILKVHCNSLVEVFEQCCYVIMISSHFQKSPIAKHLGHWCGEFKTRKGNLFLYKCGAAHPGLFWMFGPLLQPSSLWTENM